MRWHVERQGTSFSSRLLGSFQEVVSPLFCLGPAREVHVRHVLIIIQQRLKLLRRTSTSFPVVLRFLTGSEFAFLWKLQSQTMLVMHLLEALGSVEDPL